MSAPIFWNPYTQRPENEVVFGESGINFLYKNTIGKWLRPLLSRNSFLSKAYGLFQSSYLSRFQITSFIDSYKIKMSEFEDQQYRSFNDFFIRKFKHQQRLFSKELADLCAPCEARYLFFDEVNMDSRVSIKGASINPIALINDSALGKKYLGGSMAIARLCPVDYHRFHFLDDCLLGQVRPIHGRYESVNPVAVQQIEDLFFKNERSLSILETSQFGNVAMIEVGALCVGKIVQSYNSTQSNFKRGEEKGYFLFGGSTVILIFEAQKIKWNPDYLAKSKLGMETFVKLGDALGKKISG